MTAIQVGLHEKIIGKWLLSSEQVVLTDSNVIDEFCEEVGG